MADRNVVHTSRNTIDYRRRGISDIKRAESQSKPLSLLHPQFFLWAFHAALWQAWLQYLVLPHRAHFLKGPEVLPQLSHRSWLVIVAAEGPALVDGTPARVLDDSTPVLHLPVFMLARRFLNSDIEGSTYGMEKIGAIAILVAYFAKGAHSPFFCFAKLSGIFFPWPQLHRGVSYSSVESGAAPPIF